MLYGMDEDQEYVAEEFGLVKKNKLNIKKVIIFSSIFIICFLLFFGNLYISFKNLKNEELANSKNNQETNLNFEKEIIQDKNNEDTDTNTQIINNVVVTNQDSLGYYIGEHTKIAIHRIDEIKKEFAPQFNINGCQEVKDIYFSEEKQVYLTFDDGPSKDITPKVLDILKQNDVKATFFVLGARVDLYPETLRRIYDEGHYIANHGYSHQYSQIYRNKDTIFEEYIKCENSIRVALGNPEYNCFLFRFPGGSTGGRYSKIKAEGRELLDTYGIAYTNWNCLTGDAEGKTTKEECIAELINTKGEQNSLIVLMHDANDKQQTVDALPEIIQHFKNEGYTFKNFYEIF